jgi:hypothetical protein
MSDVAWHDDDVETQRVQPYKALKDYVCPGCLGTIRRGQGHLVVEAQREPAHRMLGQPHRREPAKPELLRTRHRFEGHAVTRRRPRLHLAEDEQPIALCDEVDLTFAATPVAVDHREAALLVPRRSERLSLRAERAARIRPRIWGALRHSRP